MLGKKDEAIDRERDESVGDCIRNKAYIGEMQLGRRVVDVESAVRC